MFSVVVHSVKHEAFPIYSETCTVDFKTIVIILTLLHSFHCPS